MELCLEGGNRIVWQTVQLVRKVGLTIYNLFNEEYENNGYAGSGFYYDGGEKVRYNYAGYAAQAGTNVLGHLSLNF